MENENPKKEGKKAVAEVRSQEACELAKQEYKKIGTRVARIRKSQLPKVTQNALAESAGFSFDYISKIEQGRARPTMEALAEIALALGVELKDFFVDPGEVGTWNLKPQNLTVELTNEEGQTIMQNFKLIQE